MPVATANGVAHPGAEMVKELYAAVRSGAMLGSKGPHDFAGHAQLLPLSSPQSWGIYQFGTCTCPFHFKRCATPARITAGSFMRQLPRSAAIKWNYGIILEKFPTRFMPCMR